MMPAHGASDGQGRDVEPFLLTSIGLVGLAWRRRRTWRSWRPSYLSFFSFSSTITHAFPWPIKGKAGRPMKGIDPDPHKNEPRDKNTRAPHEHTAKQRSSSQHPFTSSTRDLGSFLSLLPVCNPYCKPSVGNTSSSELDVGTFRPNQYKPLCPPSTPSEPDT